MQWSRVLRDRRFSALPTAGVAFALLGLLLTNPQPAASQASPVVIFLTSGTSWTVPSDWNNASNTIEVIGGGAGGWTQNPTDFGSGGGGGAYSKITNLSLTPGASVAYSVGSGGAASTAGGDTYFCNSTSNCASIAGAAVQAGAKGGAAATNSGQTGGVGGAAASSVGTVKYSGGQGGNGSAAAGGGGGGAAGPHGAGANGGTQSNAFHASGGGGGGANTGSAGSNTPSSQVGGNGGNGRGGTGGGAGGSGSGVNGSGGTAGGGAGGGGGCAAGGAGGSGTEFDASHGSGGGGGGGGGTISSGCVGFSGGAGANYGGGGGGSGFGDSPIQPAGAGAQGIIVITYTPETSTVPDAPTSLNATANANGINLSWTAPASDGGSPLTAYKVYRDTSSPASTLLDTTSPTTSYLDSSALVNTLYYYRVKATNAVGDSAFSNEASATRPCSSTAPSSANVHGWAWSDTIGWISLSSEDQGTCTDRSYGLNIAQDGTMSGYMWSENIGWISANTSDLSGCPTSPCTARMNGSAMEGWLKALAANQGESAWDGWISLSGTSPSYGPTVSNGVISGYAWGDMNLGWIVFNTAFSSATTTWIACTPTYQCTDGTHRDNLCTIDVVENESCGSGLICSTGQCVIPPAPTPADANGALKVMPRLIRSGGTTRVSWNINYADSCTVTEDNPQINDSWTGSTGSYTSSAIGQQTVYTLSCTGPGGSLTQHATVSQVPSWKEL